MRKATLKTTVGDITFELDDEKAPKTVENFIKYAEDNHYDGLLFHRVIDKFMIQGGGYDDKLEKRPVRDPVENEANNGLKNVRGSVAVARTPDPHSGTSQFFINVEDNPFLDHKEETPEGWGYCVFGKVSEGMDVVDKIKVVETGANGNFEKDCPLENIAIESVVIE